jgi:alpha-soluble NSF attachment protein
MSDDNAQKANQMVQKADQILSKFIYFGNRNEDALELYTKAANLYKMSKMWKEAGDCFVKTVQCHHKLDSKHEAAQAFVEAANCYRRTSPQDAQKYFALAIDMYTGMGRFSTAAKLEKELAELYEKENDDENAVLHYQNAADHYEAENAKSSTNQCLLKVGELKAKQKKFDEAITVFENAANNALDDKLLTWGAKDYLFKASVCQLAKIKDFEEELPDVKITIDGYKDMDVKFPDSRECVLIDKLINACEEKDVKAFKSALRDYDSITKLDAWKTSMFLHIKNNLEDSIKNISIA